LLAVLRRYLFGEDKRYEGTQMCRSTQIFTEAL